MTAHCYDRLAYPTPLYLTAIEIEAEAKPCSLSGGSSTHIITINNQRAGDIHQVDICVKSKVNAIILNGDPTATEYKTCFGMIRGGREVKNRFPISPNSANPSQSDTLMTAIVLYGSWWTKSNPGPKEPASVEFTVDII